MDLRRWLIHTCAIGRITGRGVDELGNPVPVTVVEQYDGPCRLVEKQERVTSDGGVGYLTSYELIIPPDAVVDEQDIVIEVMLEDGVIMTDGFTIESVVVRRFTKGKHHTVLTLDRMT